MKQGEGKDVVVPAKIYTIGHSNIALGEFIARLRAAGIDTVVDVRSQPVSKFNPHFSRRVLAEALRQAGIRYAFMGDRLGGRPDEARFYDGEGHVRYDLWAASPQFQQGITRLIAAASKYRLALMCSEADAVHCHRHLLIARVLADRGWPRSRILHISPNGECIADDAFPRQGGLFEGGTTWRSPQSVLHKVRPSASLNA